MLAIDLETLKTVIKEVHIGTNGHSLTTSHTPSACIPTMHQRDRETNRVIETNGGQIAHCIMTRGKNHFPNVSTLQL